MLSVTNISTASLNLDFDPTEKNSLLPPNEKLNVEQKGKLNSSFKEHFCTVFSIHGSNEFIEKTHRLIEKLSVLSVGSLLLTSLLNANKTFEILEGNDTFQNYNKIHLSIFNNDFYCLNKDKEGDIVLEKIKKLAIIFHELIHLDHEASDEKATIMRACKASFASPHMHNQEEELTITGSVFFSDLNGFLSENSLRKELGYNERVDHRGFPLKKGEPLTVWHLIEFNDIKNLKKAINDNPDLVHLEKQTANLAFNLNPNLNILHLGDQAIANEDMEMVDFLIQKGWKPNQDTIKRALDNKVGISDKFLQKIINKFSKMEIKISFEVFQMLVCRKYVLPFDLLINSFPIDFVYHFFVSSSSGCTTEEWDQLLAKGMKSTNEMLKVALHAHSPLKTIEYLTSHGAKPTTEILDDALSLHVSVEVIKQLVDQGAEPTKKILKKAIEEEFEIEAIEHLIKNGAKVSSSVLDKAIDESASVDTILLLVEKGAQPTTDILEDAIDEKYPIEVIKCLIENGAKPTTDILEDAITNKYPIETIKYLVEYGANPNADTLEEAIDASYPKELIEYLIMHVVEITSE